MSKPIDFYAGYPNQQRMPKWVGITLGSLFGGMLLIAVAVGARLLWPARAAEASVAHDSKPPVDKPIIVPVTAPQVAAGDVAAADDDDAPAVGKRHHHHGKATKHGKTIAMIGHSRPDKKDARFQHAQLFAKHVSTGSRRDKKSRDELDKLLGM